MTLLISNNLIWLSPSEIHGDLQIWHQHPECAIELIFIRTEFQSDPLGSQDGRVLDILQDFRPKSDDKVRKTPLDGLVYWGSANYLYCEAPASPPGRCPKQRTLFCFNHLIFRSFQMEDWLAIKRIDDLLLTWYVNLVIGNNSRYC